MNKNQKKLRDNLFDIIGDCLIDIVDVILDVLFEIWSDD